MVNLSFFAPGIEMRHQRQRQLLIYLHRVRADIRPDLAHWPPIQDLYLDWHHEYLSYDKRSAMLVAVKLITNARCTLHYKSAKAGKVIVEIDFFCIEKNVAYINQIIINLFKIPEI